MIIPINIPSGEISDGPKFPPQLAKLGTDEVILIELQGSFQVEGDKSGRVAGTLRLDENEGSKPTMIIGHHLLEGKIVNLSKPLALLEKKATGRNNQLVEDDQMDMDDPKPDDNAAHCEYDIVAVVRRKVLFSKRPMPVIDRSTIPLDTKTKGKP